MKVNKAIYLSFNAKNQSKTYINVNFPVKEIHVKSACLTSSEAVPAGLELYFTLISDLTNGEPLAQLYNNSAYSASQFCDVSFKPYKPITVSGEYTFTLYEPYGTIATEGTTKCNISMILEFNGEGENEH